MCLRELGPMAGHERAQFGRKLLPHLVDVALPHRRTEFVIHFYLGLRARWTNQNATAPRQGVNEQVCGGDAARCGRLRALQIIALHNLNAANVRHGTLS